MPAICEHLSAGSPIFSGNVLLGVKKIPLEDACNDRWCRVSHVRRFVRLVRRRLTTKLCFSSCDAEGRFTGSRIMHARMKLRAGVENLPGNSGIGFDSDPMQKIAADGAISALYTTTAVRYIMPHSDLRHECRI